MLGTCRRWAFACCTLEQKGRMTKPVPHQLPLVLPYTAKSIERRGSEGSGGGRRVDSILGERAEGITSFGVWQGRLLRGEAAICI